MLECKPNFIKVSSKKVITECYLPQVKNRALFHPSIDIPNKDEDKPVNVAGFLSKNGKTHPISDLFYSVYGIGCKSVLHRDAKGRYMLVFPKQQCVPLN